MDENSLRIAWLADSIRLAILEGVKVYHFKQNLSSWTFVLLKGDKVVAGAALALHKELKRQDGGQWWVLHGLWSDSAPATMALLNVVLKTVGHILPSTDISPAASAVVERFYKQYKGTPTVVEETGEATDPNLPPWLQAGYAWSEAVRDLNITAQQVTDRTQMRDLYKSHNMGFANAFLDSNRRKLNDPTFLLKKRDVKGLMTTLETALHGPDRYTVLPWIKKNKKQLEDIGILENVQFLVERAAEELGFSLADLAQRSGV
jgi:hypothetical protein